MKSQHPNHSPNVSTLVRVLSTHFQELVAAGADKTLLHQYESLLRFLRSKRNSDLQAIFAETVRGAKARPLAPSLSGDQIAQLSLDDLERLVSEQATTRKDLESIAIQRFNVPRGSMRSLSDKRMLVDKLLVLIRNERAHGTIGDIARAQGKRFSGDPE